MSVLIILFTAIACMGVGASLFFSIAPQFGAKAEGERLKRMKDSPHFKEGKFLNLVPTKMNSGFRPLMKDMVKFMGFGTERTPKTNVEVLPVPPERPALSQSEVRVTWFGHSASWLEIEGKHLLLDPMLGNVTSPFDWAGSKRFSKSLPIEIEALPFIDAVLISHDHYDHLDHGSILKLKDKTGHFYTPLGVGAHLEAWGVPSDKITELDWEESVQLDTLKFTSMPTRHFSGRSVNDSKNTQWCAWVIEGQSKKVLFSGDSGYFDGFKRIGERFGPFDLTLMECGQYGDSWPHIHMTPEQSAQAHLDVKGKVLLPIHWGAFSLSGHGWKDPIERVLRKAKAEGITITTPQIGESVTLGSPLPQTEWWTKVHA